MSQVSCCENQQVEVRQGRFLHVFHLPKERASVMFFFHGAGGRADQWSAQINQFKRDYAIVAPDLLGHGLSPKPLKGYSYEELSEDMRAVFSRYGGKHNIVIGHSYGVAFALRLAAEWGEKIDRVVLIGASSPRSTPRGHSMWNLPSFLLEWLRPILSKGFAKRAFHSETEKQWAQRERLVSDRNPMYIMRALFKGMTWDEEPDFSLIQQPVLLITGEADGLTPVSSAKVLCDMLPNARLEIVAKGSHLVMMERPKDVNRLIHKFVEVE